MFDVRTKWNWVCNFYVGATEYIIQAAEGHDNVCRVMNMSEWEAYDEKYRPEYVGTLDACRKYIANLDIAYRESVLF